MKSRISCRESHVILGHTWESIAFFWWCFSESEVESGVQYMIGFLILQVLSQIAEDKLDFLADRDSRSQIKTVLTESIHLCVPKRFFCNEWLQFKLTQFDIYCKSNVKAKSEMIHIRILLEASSFCPETPVKR